MEFVQPIWNIQKLEEMKEVLRNRSERDWFLMVWGLMSDFVSVIFYRYWSETFEKNPT